MPKKTNNTRTIQVDYLARVEGEGKLYVEMDGEDVGEVRLEIFEPPRFFEGLLRGRDFVEAPDITSRICGICPIAYQMSAVHAMEDALGVDIEPGIRQLRRLVYCGEWIESHTLHIYMLHAPDFLGYAGAVEMAKDLPEVVKRGLALKKAGNELVATLGGREVHPINVRVGGFYRLPRPSELRELAETMKHARELAEETLEWAATLDFPDYERDIEFVSLSHPDDYPFNEGRVVSSKGLDISVHDYDDHFEEQHLEHSTALYAVHKGHGTYFVGPMARYNLNRDRLPDQVQQAADDAGLEQVCKNPFKSILVRAVEVLFACDEALRILDVYERPEDAAADIEPHAAVGYAATEAPRGLLYHRYELAEDGTIKNARIVPPTSQNQYAIEDDLCGVVERNIAMGADELQWRCEQTIRNYDPCISCATHFLNLQINRRD